MPLVYDDVPGSWGRMSEGWPFIHDPDSEARKLVIQNKLVPYGSYATVGEYLRLETQEYVERVRAAMSEPTLAAKRRPYSMLRGTKVVVVDNTWLADVRRCLEDVSTEMRARGRGDERFQRLIHRMPKEID